MTESSDQGGEEPCWAHFVDELDQVRTSLEPLGSNTIIYCDDWPIVVEFYRHQVGLRITMEREWFVEFELHPGAHLSVADASRATVDAGTGAGITLSWRVADVTDARVRLVEQDIDASPIRQRWGADTCFVFDPAGNRIELWSPVGHPPAPGRVAAALREPTRMAPTEFPRVRAVSFTLLPAVDVADGLAVRPTQGTLTADADGLDPLKAAQRWQADGAEWIHLVDLDAAFGTGSNADLLASVIHSLDVHVELSGGIADDASMRRALRSGCDRVILATQALADTSWCVAAVAAHPDRLAVALDVRIDETADGTVEHRLAPRGQSVAVHRDLWATLELLDRVGCERYIVTDVTREGMLNGPNVELYRAVTRATPAQVIASGGISSLADLTALAQSAEAAPNLKGAIVGKALYADQFTLTDTLAAVRLDTVR